MTKTKRLFIIFYLFTTCIGCFAQREYSEVKNLFCSNATANWRLADTEENLGFLLEPLNELRLDENYVLADFRKKWDIRARPKDISSLRLYVRPAKEKLPKKKCYDKEYVRYLESKKENKAYSESDSCVSYIWPFKKIRLTGTQMSIWQAFLLYWSQYYVGMRNEANYGKEYIIASAADVDSVVSLIHNAWESDYFQGKVDTTKMSDWGTRQVKEMKIALDSLREIKAKNLAPTFKYEANDVTIEHYVFGEFYGLAKRRTTLRLSPKRHFVKDIEGKPRILIAKYSRMVFY